MLLALQNYNLKVVYKPGPEMYVRDTLSRATASGRHHTCSMHEQHTAYKQSKWMLNTSTRLTISSPLHPNANRKAEQYYSQNCKEPLREGKDAWKAVLQWRNTPNGRHE
jgi:hypothetical protein